MRKTGWMADVFVGTVCLALVFAAGCDDDDDDGGPSAPSELAQAAANAGPDQAVAYDATVTLDGSASHAAGTEAKPNGTTPTSYAWVQAAADTTQVTLADADTDAPRFTAPAVDATLNFELTVAGKTDTVTVTVQALVVDAGANVWVGGYGKAVSIPAAASGGTPGYTYAWTLSDDSPLPAAWSPVDADTDTLDLTTPSLTDLTVIPDDFGMLGIDSDAKGQIHLKLTVTDSTAGAPLTASDTVDVQIVGATNGLAVVPVGVPCFLNGGVSTPIGRTVDDATAITFDGTDSVITFDKVGLTVDDHIGEICTFETSENAYTIVSNTADSVTVTGDATGEAADDDVEILPVTTAYAWAGNGTLTTADGSTSDLAARVQMFVPPSAGDYVFVCTADGRNFRAVAVRAASYVGIGSIAGRTPNPDNGECAACHKGQYDFVADQTTAWAKTGHATIFENMVGGYYQSKATWQDAYCTQCHTTGYNELNDPAAKPNGGWDDAATLADWQLKGATWDDIVSKYPSVADKSNIQCEACHGPGSLHVGDTRGTEVNHKVEVCAQCHPQPKEWRESGHANLVGRGSGSCLRCHRGQGFADYMTTGTASALPPGTEEVGVACSACHDSHDNTHEYQLRAEGEVTLVDGSDFDFGHSAVCAECHNGRRDVSKGDELSPYAPHHFSVQGAMLAGGGGAFDTYYTAYDIKNAAHQLEGGPRCADCHMASHDASNALGGHTWKMKTGDDTEVDNGSAGALFKDTKQIRLTDASASLVGLVKEGDTIAITTTGGADDGTYVIDGIVSANILSVTNAAAFAAADTLTSWTITNAVLYLTGNSPVPPNDPGDGCNGCHSWQITDFDFLARGDYDGDSVSGETVEQEIDGLLALLKVAVEADLDLKYAADAPNGLVGESKIERDPGKSGDEDTYVRFPESTDAEWITPAGGVAWAKTYRAAYNYFFVMQDASHGIHNTGYAVGLLQASLDDLGALPVNAAPYVPQTP